MKIKQGYTYDDVLIEPVPSKVDSRDKVDISVSLSETLKLEFPLIASPMVGVVDGRFAKRLSSLGGLAILHRFYKTRPQLFWDVKDNLWNGGNFGLSIKVDEPRFEEYFDYNPKIILIDTANGYTERLLKFCSTVKRYILNNNIDCLLMAGNVATQEGAKALYLSGCDIIRALIGTGSVCITSNQTGIGVPPITALLEMTENNCDEYKIVADGGITNSGNFVKAIVAGADLAMSGRLFAECSESPNQGIIRGMASRIHMQEQSTEIKSVEGIDTPLTKKHSLSQFVREFGYGIKSAGTYLNARNLQEMYIHGNFIAVTEHSIKKGV